MIVGASARSAAESAVTSGYAVSAVDLFADVDLVATTIDRRISRRFPWDLLALQRELPPGDWLYVGGLENYPRLVDRISTERRLLGAAGDVLRRVRDVRALAVWGAEAGFETPEVSSEPNFAGEPLLWKARRSAGGLGVLRANDATAGGNGYFQRFIDGAACGGLFLSTGRTVRLLGVALQLSAPSERGQSYRYGGSVILPGDEGGSRTEWASLGEGLATEFGLRGLFGVDAIVDAAGKIWLLEVNPRPTASMELFERSLSTSLVDLHVRACRNETIPELPLPSEATLHGKQIVYADHKDRMTPRLVERWLNRRDADGRAQVADISPVGTVIDRDLPLATVFASGSTTDDVVASLYNSARRTCDEFHGIGF